MARSYVITENKLYKKNFYQILAIRNGLEPRPEYYPVTYWYLSDLLSTGMGKAVPLKTMMAKMGFTNKEFSLLEEAQNRSDKLALLEKKAFAALDSKLPNTKNYAINLLFGLEYQQAKIEIMQPIQKFISLVENRILKENSAIYKQQFYYLIINVVFFLMIVVLGGVIAYYIKRYVLNPILKLANETSKITENNYNYKTAVHINNEVGQLGQCIENMANKISDNTQKLIKIAATDELTGISNRRHFFYILEREMHRANRHQRELSILMMDIDHFKIFNDKHGHLVGDEVLKHICKLAIAELRINDLIGRIGGEEFDILLPETSIVDAKKLAERIRQTIERSSLEWNNEKLFVTVSIGITAMQPNEQAQTFLKRVDKAMYHAKENGRNQIATL